MEHFYQDLDRVGGLDYQIHPVPELGDRIYRGPAVDLSKPYIAFVGAAQTFGRFVEAPFASLLSERLGLPALNLGVGGAGPRHFLAPRYAGVLNRAEAVVLQVLSGRSASNSQFDNSSSGGLLGESRLGSGAMRAEEFLARALETSTRDEFRRLIEEMRADYVASYLRLIEGVTAPKILLWISKRKPAYEETFDNLHGVLGDFPQLVNERMIAELAAHCDAYVEVVSSQGLPQKLWRSEQAIDGAALRGDMLVNRYYPSPEMHIEAADRLEAPCRAFLGRYPAAEPPAAQRFIVTGPERTGTNLLVGLLNQHTGCFCGGELFNSGVIGRGKIPWLEMSEAEEARLHALRQDKPLEFLTELQTLAEARGHGVVVGFKLLYNHGLGQPAVMEALAADTSIKVIHVTRRNLLRRLISERQARATNVWSVGRGAEPVEMPKVEIDLLDLAKSLALTQQKQETFERTFAGHRVMRIVYEDLAARPAHVAARAAQFLGLPPLTKRAIVNFRKTGSEDASQALEGFESLRAQVRRWASFFDGL